MNFSVKEKVVSKFKIKNPKNIWIDKFICLRSKTYSFKCSGESTNKLNRNFKSQSKHIKFEEEKIMFRLRKLSARMQYLYLKIN